MAEAAQQCDECGSAMPVWYAPNELWNRIVGSPNGFLCPDCFNHACEAAGELLVWRAGRAGEVEDLEAQLDGLRKMLGEEIERLQAEYERGYGRFADSEKSSTAARADAEAQHALTVLRRLSALLPNTPVESDEECG